MKNKIAVLITCFNRKEKTIKCLESFYEAEVPRDCLFDIYLVDDGSTDGTSLAIEKNFPEVHIIKGTGELFWNRGMHLAWQTAIKNYTYDFYLWLNDDVKIFKNSLKNIFTDHSFYPLSIITGVMVSEIDGRITYGGENRKGQLIQPLKNDPKPCFYLNGNLVLIPKVVFQKIGTLDPLFPHAIGDFDYGLRAQEKGIECRISTEFLGYCESNPELPAWCRPQVSFKDRLKSLYSPLGYSHPYYFFIYEKRHFGFFTAFKHLFSIHLRVIAPKLWK